MRLRGALADHREWSPADTATLRREYARGGIHAARAALPDRSMQSLYKKARRLGVMRRRRWTKADDARLRALWSAGDNELGDIAAALGRTIKTTYHRAQQLGLPLGCPDGYEYLTDAARRTGYCTSQLWPILRAARVGVHRSRARPGVPKRGRPVKRTAFHIVWPSDVNNAIAAWNEGEPLNSAAARLGVCGETLSRWLSDIGVTKPAKLGRRRWRVHGDDVARAVAQRRAA